MYQKVPIMFSIHLIKMYFAHMTTLHEYNDDLVFVSVVKYLQRIHLKASQFISLIFFFNDSKTNTGYIF